MELLFLNENELKNALTSNKIRVGVFGLGYVGLPLAVAWCKAGANVFGVTKNEKHLKLLKSGICPFSEDQELLEEYRDCYQKGKIEVTDDSEYVAINSDLKIITVPIPYREDFSVDYSALIDVARTIGKNLKRGDIVDLESSVPPGTTENILLKILEEESKLKFKTDFGLVYSPERIYIGRALKDLRENYPKIIGSTCGKSLAVMKEMYEQISKKGVIIMNNFLSAELEKLFEGVYRDVNIALANELADLCEKLGVSYEEIKKAANSQPFCHLHDPGIGVGGFCIPTYSYYILLKAKELNLEPNVVSYSRKVNESLPISLAKKLVSKLEREQNLKNLKLLVLGLAFRGNTSDTRNSPAIDFINTLVDKFGEVYAFDPFVEEVPSKLDGRVKVVREIKEFRNFFGVICIVTDHKIFKEFRSNEILSLLCTPRIVVDFKRVLPEEVKHQLFSLGVRVYVRGEGNFL